MRVAQTQCKFSKKIKLQIFHSILLTSQKKGDISNATKRIVAEPS